MNQNTKTSTKVDNVEVSSYRGFDDCTFTGFGQVNLITGKNNVGKTALLEAIHLASWRGADHALADVFRARGEWSSTLIESERSAERALAMMILGSLVKDRLPTGFVVGLNSGELGHIAVIPGYYRHEDGGHRTFLTRPKDVAGSAVAILSEIRN